MSLAPYPTRPEEVTEAWVEKILLENVADTKQVKILSLQTESDDAKSGIFRLNI